jgi:hypothetical protein
MYMGKTLDPSIYTRARDPIVKTQMCTPQGTEIGRRCTAKRQPAGEAQGPRGKPARGNIKGNATRQKGEEKEVKEGNKTQGAHSGGSARIDNANNCEFNRFHTSGWREKYCRVLPGTCFSPISYCTFALPPAHTLIIRRGVTQVNLWATTVPIAIPPTPTRRRVIPSISAKNGYCRQYQHPHFRALSSAYARICF